MYTLGIDIGSTTSKCVILQDGASITARSLQLGGLGTDGPEDALTELWQESGLTRADMARVIVTGYGRNKFEGADGEVSELTCHALGGRFVFPDLRTVIDIGGQDAKIISLTPDGRMSNFIMNDKCAAGTGRFLEVMANILRLDIDDLGAIAAESDTPAAISSTCTVFAESEVISLVDRGEPRENIAHGIIESVVSRVASLAGQGSHAPYFLTGGLCENDYVVERLGALLGSEVTTCPEARYAGAIGAALKACEL